MMAKWIFLIIAKINRHYFRYINNKGMSRAFVKEVDEQWLHDILPSMDALINYLTRENNNIRVYERNSYVDSINRCEIHEMSNGLSYAVDENNKWKVVGSL
jgi:hypothetical protein